MLSTTLQEGRAEHVTITPGPVTDLAATLRDGEGTAWLVGGGRLFSAFAAAGLIDLWIVTVIPVLLGDGVPLFPAHGEAYQRLELAETRTLPDGYVQLHYRPRADPRRPRARGSDHPTPVVHFWGKPGGRGGAASRRFSEPARRPSRKVRTPQSRALANGQPGKPEGKRNREQTASGLFRGVRVRVKR